MNDPANRIWSYLHNEMDEEEKKFFKQALREDRELREAFQNCCITHRELENILPVLDSDEFAESIENQLLAEWEADHPQYAEDEKPKAKRRILIFSAPLAAAAALFVLLSLPSPDTALRWQKTAYGAAPTVRGEAAGDAHYSRADLKEIDRLLREAVESASEQHQPLAEKWVLRISIQELAGGALSTEVSGHPRSAPDRSQTWHTNFTGIESFRANVAQFGNLVAQELSEPTD